MMISTFKNTLLMASAVCLCLVIEPATVQAQSYDGAAAAASEIRFQQLEKEIRRLTGQIEEQNYEIRRLKDDIAKAAGDLSVRVSDLEAGRGGSAAPRNAQDSVAQLDTSPPVMGGAVSDGDIGSSSEDDGFTYQSSGAEPQSLGTYQKSPETGEARPSKDAAAAYDYAYSFIKARNYDRAEDEFANFMRDYPNNALVSNAKYWYGETFYVRRNYEKAARVFAEGYQAYPKSSKAPSNLLKLGMALTGMNKKDEACIAYKQLQNQYAKSSVPVLKRAETEMKKIDCR